MTGARHLLVGFDVGSTTVKAVAVEPMSGAIVWKDYQRHETRQPEKCLDFLERIEASFPDVPRSGFRVFMTGTGGGAVARHLGAHFVQEVNAVALAVERLYPDVHSVLELGGQDAKVIIFKTDPNTGRKRKIPSMNDKCAGGTGAVIDKIAAKLGIPQNVLCQMGYTGLRLHPVAGKCGVFAETDINSLQKQGVPPEELMASLFESLAQQNLSVLTRGHTLRPTVLLLGGPNFFIKGLQECWRRNIPLVWQERNIQLPPNKTAEELIIVPENAQYFAAIGAVEFGRTEIEEKLSVGAYRGVEPLRQYIRVGRAEEKSACSSRALVEDEAALQAFKKRFAPESWTPPVFRRGSVVSAFIGLDGGSTSTKAVLVDLHQNVIAKAYQLSKGNPIEDTKDVFAALERQIADQGCALEILGVGTTGYAKDILKDVIGADVALVETVAHTQSGRHYYPDADVICDVGGQDIKIIILKNGAVKDFRLNTQCSAGNGYYLQSTAAAFGYDVTEYAEVAFTARSMPQFGYGCAVFMQTDIVDFQRQGWQPNEILAGLAAVLPKNIWLYVCKIPNLAALGRTFVLQGGTQRNLAAVKAQVDFIESRFAGSGVRPRIVVHKHCGESGAIGCAFEVHRLYHEQELHTSFIGLKAVQAIRYRTTRNELTRCDFCKNNCMRTFIDVTTTASNDGGVDIDTHPIKLGPEVEQPSRIKHGAGRPQPPKLAPKVPLRPGERRLIIATCEKGTVEDVDDMRAIKKDIEAVKKANPNLVEVAARELFKPVCVEVVVDPLPTPSRFSFNRRAVLKRRVLMEKRRDLRIGIPRVLNLYGLAPFFMGYFQSVGIPGDHIVWSDYTSEKLFKEGARRGSIDPCFPSKVCIPHVHNLLHHKHTDKKPLTHIFFPMADSIPSWLTDVMDTRGCPTAVATPEATHAAFIKEGDVFAEKGIRFKKTFLNLANPLLCGRQMFEDWADDLGLTQEESTRAVLEGMSALRMYCAARRREGREVLDMLERENRLGIVLLARPYFSDPGIHHGICDEFQKLGYPILTPDALPLDEDLLERLFGEEIAAGQVIGATCIGDVWKNSYSENASRKLWAAKYAARHPNLVALELSNFKCGNDAPIYTAVEQIVERSGTPYFYFKDLDENKPAGSIKIRIETIAYFLRRYHERMLADRLAREEIEALLKDYERQLRAALHTAETAAVA